MTKAVAEVRCRFAPLCNLTFKKPTAMRAHCRAQHAKDILGFCKFCQKLMLYKSRRAEYDHMIRHKQPCKHCEKPLSVRYLSAHEEKCKSRPSKKDEEDVGDEEDAAQASTDAPGTSSEVAAEVTAGDVECDALVQEEVTLVSGDVKSERSDAQYAELAARLAAKDDELRQYQRQMDERIAAATADITAQMEKERANLSAFLTEENEHLDALGLQLVELEEQVKARDQEIARLLKEKQAGYAEARHNALVLHWLEAKTARLEGQLSEQKTRSKKETAVGASRSPKKRKANDDDDDDDACVARRNERMKRLQAQVNEMRKLAKRHEEERKQWPPLPRRPTHTLQPFTW